jgi:hypothetical protein
MIPVIKKKMIQRLFMISPPSIPQMRVDIGAVDSSVAAGTPAYSFSKPGCVGEIAHAE